MSIKLVDSTNYHLWTDALHFRQLARQSGSDWDRGTYVRGCIREAWTAFEMVCGEALNATGLGNRFREGFDKAVAAKGLKAVDWSQGIWQKILVVYSTRKEFVHVHSSITKERLCTPQSEADKAIEILREGIKAVCDLVGDPQPMWLKDDEDPGWHPPRRGIGATLTGIRAGAVETDPEVIKIGFEAKGERRFCDLFPPGTDYKPELEDLIKRLNVPVAAVVAYRGETLLERRELNARGS